MWFTSLKILNQDKMNQKLETEKIKTIKEIFYLSNTIQYLKIMLLFSFCLHFCFPSTIFRFKRTTPALWTFSWTHIHNLRSVFRRPPHSPTININYMLHLSCTVNFNNAFRSPAHTHIHTDINTVCIHFTKPYFRILNYAEHPVLLLF